MLFRNLGNGEMVLHTSESVVFQQSVNRSWLELRTFPGKMRPKLSAGSSLLTVWNWYTGFSSDGAIA